MGFKHFCRVADRYGLTAAIRGYMNYGFSRYELMKWELRYMKEKAQRKILRIVK